MSKRNDFTNLLVSKRLHHIHARRLPRRDDRGSASRRLISLPRTCEIQPSYRTVMRLCFAATKRTVTRLSNDA